MVQCQMATVYITQTHAHTHRGTPGIHGFESLFSLSACTHTQTHTSHPGKWRVTLCNTCTLARGVPGSCPVGSRAPPPLQTPSTKGVAGVVVLTLGGQSHVHVRIHTWIGGDLALWHDPRPHSFAASLHLPYWMSLSLNPGKTSPGDLQILLVLL